eukprot:scaffold192145_cov18-Tisochrysis_lutea.AAC.2
MKRRRRRKHWAPRLSATACPNGCAASGRAFVSGYRAASFLRPCSLPRPPTTYPRESCQYMRLIQASM